jgi:gluconate 5-dehydrogenase
MSDIMNRLFDMTGRIAIVTGGGRGLGKDFATGLAEAGAHVLIGSRKIANCEAVVAEIVADGGSAEAFPLDMSKPESIDGFLAELDRREIHPDILINNAGISWGGMLFEYPLSGWDKVFDLDVRGLFYITQQLTRRMRDRGQKGVVLNVGSIGGTGGQPDRPSGQIAYVGAKAAVHAMTKDFAIKLAPFGIRVNAVAPGPFLTDIFAWGKSNPNFEDALNKAIPLGYTGSSDDIKATALYMCSRGCKYLTGQTLNLDGGLTALLPNG